MGETSGRKKGRRGYNRPLDSKRQFIAARHTLHDNILFCHTGSKKTFASTGQERIDNDRIPSRMDNANSEPRTFDRLTFDLDSELWICMDMDMDMAAVLTAECLTLARSLERSHGFCFNWCMSFVAWGSVLRESRSN